MSYSQVKYWRIEVLAKRKKELMPTSDLPLPAKPLKTALATEAANSTPEAIMHLNSLFSPLCFTTFLHMSLSLAIPANRQSTTPSSTTGPASWAKRTRPKEDGLLLCRTYQHAPNLRLR